jgi:hypothetical protein
MLLRLEPACFIQHPVFTICVAYKQQHCINQALPIDSFLRIGVSSLSARLYKAEELRRPFSPFVCIFYTAKAPCCPVLFSAPALKCSAMLLANNFAAVGIPVMKACHPAMLLSFLASAFVDKIALSHSSSDTIAGILLSGWLTHSDSASKTDFLLR